MTNESLCFDAWTVRQIDSDDFGQDGWTHDDSVDYRQVDEDPYDNDDGSRGIEVLDHHGLIQDAANFADKLIGSFISLAF